MRMRRGTRIIAVVVLGTATAGCYNNRMCGPTVWATSMLVGGAAVGGGVAAATDGDTGPTAGGAAGGVVAGAILAPWLYHWICHNEVAAAPPPPAKATPPERKPIETLTGPNFDFDKATLRPEGKAKVDHVVALMREHPDMRVSVEGHTDSVGTDAYNQKLSERRAHTVADYMAAQGIAASRVTTHGFGESKPIASNDTAEGRAQNRRVEIFAE